MSASNDTTSATDTAAKAINTTTTTAAANATNHTADVSIITATSVGTITAASK
jgi:hypothetical protein